MGKLVSTMLASTVISLMTGTACAENLVQVYEQAILNDATFRKAQADWLTARMNFPLALTGNGQIGTGLFPNVLVSGSLIPWYYQRQSNGFGVSQDVFSQNTLTINVDQPLFNLSTWMAISSARYTVKAAMARFLAAAQDLMNRTAFAYFEVLRAQDTLTLRLAQERQFLNQLVTSEEKFKVGLIAITGVYNAQASYDRAVAQEIADRNTLHDKLENLRAITGRLYSELNGLKVRIPLVLPKPRNMETWVKVAIRQNYVIQTDLNVMYSTRQNVKVAASAVVPTFDFTGQYQVQTTGGVFAPIGNSGFVLPRTTIKTAYAGFSMNFPVFRGGYDIANVKSNQYKYLSASDQLEMDYRDTMNKTRQAFLGIDSGIYQIQADAEAILSARNQLEATEAGYVVGTRTMVDVLDAVTTLTQNQLAYADARYNYVESIFNLKLAAGTLSPIDIKKVNCWLAGPIRFQLQQDVGKIRRISSGKYPPVNLLQINQPKFTTPPGENLPGVGGDRAPTRGVPLIQNTGPLPVPTPYVAPSVITPNYPPSAPRGRTNTPTPPPGLPPSSTSPSSVSPSSSPARSPSSFSSPSALPSTPSPASSQAPRSTSPTPGATVPAPTPTPAPAPAASPSSANEPIVPPHHIEGLYATKATNLKEMLKHTPPAAGTAVKTPKAVASPSLAKATGAASTSHSGQFVPTKPVLPPPLKDKVEIKSAHPIMQKTVVKPTKETGAAALSQPVNFVPTKPLLPPPLKDKAQIRAAQPIHSSSLRPVKISPFAIAPKDKVNKGSMLGLDASAKGLTAMPKLEIAKNNSVKNHPSKMASPVLTSKPIDNKNENLKQSAAVAHIGQEKFEMPKAKKHLVNKMKKAKLAANHKSNNDALPLEIPSPKATTNKEVKGKLLPVPHETNPH